MRWRSPAFDGAVLHSTNVANGLAADGGTPSPVGVVLNLAQSPEPDVIGVKSVVVDDLPDLVGLDLFDGCGTIPVRTADLQDVAILDGGDDVTERKTSKLFA